MTDQPAPTRKLSPEREQQALNFLEGVARRQVRAEMRAEAIAAYQRAAELAVRMGEGQRVTTRPLSIFSRTEIEHMTAGLFAALDKVAAGVPGYARKVQTVTDQPAPTA